VVLPPNHQPPTDLPPADLVEPHWSAERLTHNPMNGATGGIWRVRRDRDTAVLKVLTPPGRDAVPAHWRGSDDPGHWNYWRREALAYRDGLARRAYAAGGIRPPGLLSSVDRPDGSVALWLEDVAGEPGTAATPSRLGAFAQRLGAGHAAWLGCAPNLPWLSRDWLRDYTLTRPVAEHLDWNHPTVAAAWPDDLRAALRDLWAYRHEVIAATRILPQTLCHHDVWPMNMVYGGAGPVLLDWSFVGPGPVGEDPANLILDTFFDGLVDVALLDEVAEAVTAGYLRGLGGAAAPDAVRRAIHLAGAAKYFWLAPLMVGRLGAATAISQTYDTRDAAGIFAGRRRPLELVAAWFRETRPVLPG
jgi:hypothetical protein